MSADSQDWMAGGSRVAAGSTTGKLNSWWAGWLGQFAQGRLERFGHSGALRGTLGHCNTVGPSGVLEDILGGSGSLWNARGRSGAHGDASGHSRSL